MVSRFRSRNLLKIVFSPPCPNTWAAMEQGASGEQLLRKPPEISDGESEQHSELGAYRFAFDQGQQAIERLPLLKEC